MHSKFKFPTSKYILFIINNQSSTIRIETFDTSNVHHANSSTYMIHTSHGKRAHLPLTKITHNQDKGTSLGPSTTRVCRCRGLRWSIQSAPQEISERMLWRTVKQLRVFIIHTAANRCLTPSDMLEVYWISSCCYVIYYNVCPFRFRDVRAGGFESPKPQKVPLFARNLNCRFVSIVPPEGC